MPLPAFLKQQGVPSDWNLLLFGDGSGLKWEIGGGFAVFLIDKARGLREHVVGAISKSTVNRMELSAYVHGLAYHYHDVLKGKITEPPYNVWIFSDSEFTVKTGQGKNRIKANADLWSVINWFETRGYRLNWRWNERNSTPLGTMADWLAGNARRAVKALELESNELYELMPVIPSVATTDLVVCEKCNTPRLPSEACPVCGEEECQNPTSGS
jgi:ribonuclease HI